MDVDGCADLLPELQHRVARLIKLVAHLYSDTDHRRVRRLLEGVLATQVERDWLDLVVAVLPTEGPRWWWRQQVPHLHRAPYPPSINDLLSFAEGCIGNQPFHIDHILHVENRTTRVYTLSSFYNSCNISLCSWDQWAFEPAGLSRSF